MAFDAKSAAAEIVRLVGGKENINSVAHCMTRLRFVVKDLKKADQEALKKVPGVLGVIYAGGQLMVVLGKNLLPVYETVVKDFDLLEGAAVNENLDAPAEKKPLTLKSAGVAVLEYVSAAVAPMITGLVAGGMLKVVLLLITLVNAGFADTATYALLSGLADAPFFFMPIFAAYGAAKKLGGTPIYSMMCAAALLHGKYTALVAAGEPITLLGLPVRLMSYSSSLLPALLIALCAYYLEKFFNKIIPGIFKSLLVGLCTVTVTVVLGFTVLAPLGGYLGNYLAVVFGFLGEMLRTLSESVLQIETAIDNLLAQRKEMRNNVSLLQSIPGVGSHSAAFLLGEIGDISLFKKPKQLAAYWVLDPTERQSGSFRGTKNKLSKRGFPYARAALHMGVVNSICKRGKDSAANPVLLSYYEKKCKNKPAKVAQAASMHKLVFIVFAVLRDQMPFELKTPEQHAVEQGFVKAA